MICVFINGIKFSVLLNTKSIKCLELVPGIFPGWVTVAILIAVNVGDKLSLQ